MYRVIGVHSNSARYRMHVTHNALLFPLSRADNHMLKSPEVPEDWIFDPSISFC